MNPAESQNTTAHQRLVENIREIVERETLDVLRAITNATERQARTRAVRNAIGMIGMSAEPGNRGKLVRQVAKGQEGVMWCAYFLMHCWEQAGIGISDTLYRTLATKPFRQALQAFASPGVVTLRKPNYLPKPGDIAIFAPRNLDDPSPLAGHVAMVLYPFSKHNGERDGLCLLEPNVKGTDERLGIPSDRTGIETREVSERELRLRRLYGFAVPRL